ncbi:MAG TPA: glycosyltransferase family A protein [Thermoanaerobaculia bacterium]|jgi:hypothetical protein|nr:glycosyltransferase family A protein [Thermoanaerobaculia bacterium]
MTIDLHIVTPCIRIGNLPAIARSILSATVPDDVLIHWLVVLDDRFGLDLEPAREAAAGVPRAVVELARAAGPGEYASCNQALEQIRDGWIIFIDDDNLLHPALPKRLSEVLRSRSGVGAVVYDQDLGDSFRRASPRNTRVGKIDSAQFAVSRELVGGHRFEVYAPSADGLFIERLYATTPERFVFLSEVLASYNVQTPGEFGRGKLRRLSRGPLPAAHTAGSLYFHATADVGDVRLSSGGDRLFLPCGTALRAPALDGRQRIEGVAWMDAGSRTGGRIRICVSGRLIAEVDLPAAPFWVFRWLPPPLYRILSRITRRRIRFSAVFDAKSGEEIEIFHDSLSERVAEHLDVGSEMIGDESLRSVAVIRPVIVVE